MITLNCISRLKHINPKQIHKNKKKKYSKHKIQNKDSKREDLVETLESHSIKDYETLKIGWLQKQKLKLGFRVEQLKLKGE